MWLVNEKKKQYLGRGGKATGLGSRVSLKKSVNQKCDNQDSKVKHPITIAWDSQDFGA